MTNPSNPYYIRLIILSHFSLNTSLSYPEANPIVCINCFISLPLFTTCVGQSAIVKPWKHDQPTYKEKWKRDETADTCGKWCTHADVIKYRKSRRIVRLIVFAYLSVGMMSNTFDINVNFTKRSRNLLLLLVLSSVPKLGHEFKKCGYYLSSVNLLCSSSMDVVNILTKASS